MTRSYDVVVLIEGYEPGHEESIRLAIEDQWDLDCPIESWSDPGDGVLEASGCCSLYANDRPEGFASRLAESVWRANDGYCNVGVAVVQPGLWVQQTVTYTTTPGDYRSWLRTGELPYAGERTRGASFADAAA